MLVYQDVDKGEIAKALKITPQTLSNWLNPGKNPDFVEAYDKELENAESMRKRNYKKFAQKAQDKLIELIDSSRPEIALKACKDILDRAGDKPIENVNINGKSEKLSDILDQVGGGGLEE